MADFQVWDQKNLAKFAEDSQKYIEELKAERDRLHKELIKVNNEHAKVLTILRNLMNSYKRQGDIYRFTPEKHDSYKFAEDVFK